MADRGNLASFGWEGVTYSTNDCLSAWDFADSINDIVYQCNGYDKHLGGTRALEFRFSIGLDADDTTKISPFVPGTESTQFEAHPGGSTTNYIEITSTKAVVLSRDITAPMNGIIGMSVVIALDNAVTTVAA